LMASSLAAAAALAAVRALILVSGMSQVPILTP
jgi:hypothetical protein